MKNLIFIILISITAQSQTFFDRDWATYYLGGSGGSLDVIIDSQENIIICGFIRNIENSEFYTQFTTPGAFQTTVNYGDSDGFLCKFSPEGNLIWATYFGGVGNETIYSIALDENDNIYGFSKTTSFSNIATPGAFLTDLPSNPASYIVNFNTNGERIWCTYFPNIISAMTIKDDKIYIIGLTKETTNIATEGTFGQIAIQESDTTQFVGVNSFINIFDLNGNRLLGSYIGKTAFGVTNIYPMSINIDSNDDIIVSGITRYDSYLTFSTPNSHQETYGGGPSDLYISKFSNDLSQRYWGTYFGGSGSEEDNFIVLDELNNIYLIGSTSSTNAIATSNVFQFQNAGIADGFLAKFNPEGEQLWGTYFGGAQIDYLYDLRLQNNKLFFAGKTHSDYLSTPNVFQQNIGSETESDGVFGAFSIDGNLLWSSYYGGEKDDGIFGITVSNNEDIYICGFTQSLTGISSPNSQQPNFIPASNPTVATPSQNMFLAKFKEVPLSNSSFTKNNISLFPNPNQGSFTITGLEDKNTLSIFDTSGRKIVEKTTNQNLFSMETTLSKGIYFVEVISNNNEKQVVKMVVE